MPIIELNDYHLFTHSSLVHVKKNGHCERHGVAREKYVRKIQPPLFIHCQRVGLPSSCSVSDFLKGSDDSWLLQQA